MTASLQGRRLPRVPDRGTLTSAPAPPGGHSGTAFRAAVGCIAGVEHRQLDARHGGGLVHDHARLHALHGGAGAGGHARCRSACWRCRPARSPTAWTSAGCCCVVQWVMLLLAAAARACSCSPAASRSRSLLAITFGLGACTAVMSPTWQSIIPRLVPREDLQPAVALHAVGMNIARAIGPALAGLIIARLGIALALPDQCRELPGRDLRRCCGGGATHTAATGRTQSFRARCAPASLTPGQPPAAEHAVALGTVLPVRQCLLGAAAAGRA